MELLLELLAAVRTGAAYHWRPIMLLARKPLECSWKNEVNFFKQATESYSLEIGSAAVRLECSKGYNLSPLDNVDELQNMSNQIRVVMQTRDFPVFVEL